MKALADTGDTSISAKAYLVRRLWRWPDPEIRQAARVALNMLRRKPAARKGIAVARLVKAEIDDRVRQDPFKPVSLTNVYGAVAERLRRDGRKIKDRTVKEYWETWGSSLPWIEAKEQEDLVEKLEAEAKAHRDALFYENAAKWEPEE
jgi:hypothetical protein